MKIKLYAIFISIFFVITAFPTLCDSVSFEDFDVGVGDPTNITNGDIRLFGEDSLFVTISNNGELPAEPELDFELDRLDGLEWVDIDSGTNGPYDLDPDVWIESFFDISYLNEGYYRATFSLDTPLENNFMNIGNNWSDDNPSNDVYQVVFRVVDSAFIHEWYVDSSAPPDGDGSKEHPFHTISDAITRAESSDRIWVNSGVYNENLNINIDRITISPYQDIINNLDFDCIIDGGGNGNVVSIKADRVSFSGFIVRNCGSLEEDTAIDITSDYNNVGWNILEDNGASGVYLHDSANYNYIHHNIIQNNDGAGIFIWQQSKNNWIYHNDFINNGWYNVKDKEGDNNWNHISTYGGNYWDDYQGSDNNGDGIGENPYDIMGDFNPTGLDEYPWVEPHKWNNHLSIPIIIGPSNGKAGSEYEYEFYVEHENFGPGSDPFTEPAVCHVEWGDESEQWARSLIIPSTGQLKVTIKHTFAEEGDYNLRVQFIDGYGFESDWTTLEVSMPKSRSINLFERLIDNILFHFPFLSEILRILY